MIISITGKSGSGKTFIANKIASKINAEIISFDKISHQVLENKDILKEIKTHFGDKIFENNQLNRKILGNIVFNNSNELEYLNNLVQSKMENIIDNYLLKTSSKIIILDYALLPKMKYFKNSDCKILIKSDTHLRKTRIISRDQISEEYFLFRDQNSLNFDEKMFDIIVENNSTLDFDSLMQKIKEVLCLEKL